MPPVLAKESDRGAQPYAFVVAFGREDAGVRLSVRRELAGLMAVAVRTMKPCVIKLLAPGVRARQRRRGRSNTSGGF